jgi:hypothetical protein
MTSLSNNNQPITSNTSESLLDPNTVINTMIALRIQLAELEQQIQALQPAFFAACLALDIDNVTLEHATISRRLTPGQWAYPPDVLQQQDSLKHLKQQFRQTHEPVSGRDVTWAIKLLLLSV